MTPDAEAATEPAKVVDVRPPLPGFRNPVAIRIAVFAAFSSMALFFLPFLNYFLAGFFAVLFYRRRTGASINVESGIRMGWMTGLLTFAMLAFLMAAGMFAINAIGGVAVVQAQLKNAIDPRYLEALKQLQNVPQMLGEMVFLFVFVTCLSMAGGALGAKVAGRS